MRQAHEAGHMSQGTRGSAHWVCLEGFRWVSRFWPGLVQPSPKRLQKQPPCPPIACPTCPFSNRAMAQSAHLITQPWEVHGSRGCHLGPFPSWNRDFGVTKGSGGIGLS